MDTWQSCDSSGQVFLVGSHLLVVKLMEHEERQHVGEAVLVQLIQLFKSRTLHSLDRLYPEQTCQSSKCMTQWQK